MWIVRWWESGPLLPVADPWQKWKDWLKCIPEITPSMVILYRKVLKIRPRYCCLTMFEKSAFFSVRSYFRDNPITKSWDRTELNLFQMLNSTLWGLADWTRSPASSKHELSDIISEEINYWSIVASWDSQNREWINFLPVVSYWGMMKD